uniref:Pept_C1 domain-containing protein n=1 Tax=Caenorhabditis tropicalis TaxID=1561998 RepID=A0A1I7U4G4_9PELO
MIILILTGLLSCIRKTRLNKESQAAGHDTTFGINKFADLSSGEFNGRLSHTKPNNTGIPVLDASFFRQAVTNKTRHKRRSTRYPDYLDLRTMKVNGDKIVGRVKNQGECACCWGFAVTALIETVNAVATGEFTSLSDQELCDCGTEGTPGCKGGNLNLGVRYVRQYGLTTDELYTYDQDRAKVGRRCRVAEYRRVVPRRAFNFASISARKAEEEIIKVLNEWKVPVAVYFMVGESLRLYKKGMIVKDDCNPRAKDAAWHAGVIVGYDTIADENGREYDYWIIKNSWDDDWGESGYFRVIRGADWCAIEESPVTGRMDSYY